MSEEKNQNKSELFDTPVTDESKSTKDSEGNPGAGSTTRKSEENQEHALSADENKQKQIDVWQKRVDDGEVSKEEVPHWVQKEIKSLRSNEDVKKLIKQEAEALIERREAEKLYQAIRADLNTRKLPAATKLELDAEYKDLLSRKYLPDEAIIRAMRYAQVPTKEQHLKQSKRKAMNLPTNSMGESFHSEPSVEDMSDDDIVTQSEKSIGGNYGPPA